MSAPGIDPFDDLIVTDPRRREPAVRELNERPLRVLLDDFARLCEGAPPRPARGIPQARLIVSEQPGHGKSHLIGRLFRELHGRATLVYVRPLQNPAVVFQTLMMAVVREMNFPDRAEPAAWNAEEATQLDRLAHGVLAHLLADLVESGRDVQSADPKGDAAFLRRDPLGALNRGAAGDTWADWLREHFGKLLPLFEEALAGRGIELNSPGWLRVLFAYCFHPFDRPLRQAALDWLTAQSLGAVEAARLGLRMADALDPELTAGQSSDLCRTRLADLCQLARCFRPFVFCFDQTEIYGHNAALARSFGMVIAALVNEAPNHLTLVTSNQSPWQNRIAPHIEDADLARLAQPPLPLEGLTRRQGEELIRLRLAAGEASDPAGRFADAAWLGALFPTERNQMGARHFLQKCKERWAKNPLPAATLDEVFERHRVTLLADPKRHLFEPETLQWLIGEAVRGLPDLEVEWISEPYFSVRWSMPEGACLFGFEAGSHWRRWLAIAQSARRRAEERSSFKAVVFRTPEQPSIPGDWQAAEEIEVIKAASLQVVELSAGDLAELYAARELFADAAQGDIAFNTEAVLEFLHARLAPWWRRFREPFAPAPEVK